MLHKLNYYISIIQNKWHRGRRGLLLSKVSFMLCHKIYKTCETVITLLTKNIQRNVS
jgi:hypothetical protein